jgi:predicted phosphoadenosine phosphosulfate sulfurtransferase
MPTKSSKKFRGMQVLDQDVYQVALERAEYMLDHYDHCWVAFSGGKDSTAALNVTLEVLRSDPVRWSRHLPLRVVFQDEEAIPLETVDYVRRVFSQPDVAGEWLCIPLKHRNACSRHSPHWWPWAPEAKDLWCRELPPEAITEVPGFPVWPASDRLSAPHTNPLLCPPERGSCLIIQGLRAQESLIRRRAVTNNKGAEVNYVTHVKEGHRNVGNVYKGYPVYDWTLEDVWRAVRVKGWDWNRAYDRMEQAGVSRPQQRCSPAFGEEPLQKLWMFASCFPEVWDKMLDRVPGVGAAQRYAKTELWGHHGQPPKPEGMSWPEWVRNFVDKWGEERNNVADRIRNEIARHYRLSTDPILPTARHPDSGVSWRYLVMIAMRGDLKRRRQSGMGLHSDEDNRPLPEYWHRYAAELDDVLETGEFAQCGYLLARPHFVMPTYAREEAAAL